MPGRLRLDRVPGSSLPLLHARRAARCAAGTADGPAVTRRTVAPLQAFADLLDRATALAASGTVVEILDLLLQTTGYQDYLFGEFEDAEANGWIHAPGLRIPLPRQVWNLSLIHI